MSPQKRTVDFYNRGKVSSNFVNSARGDSPAMETKMREDGKGTYQAPQAPNIEVESLSDNRDVAEEV